MTIESIGPYSAAFLMDIAESAGVWPHHPEGGECADVEFPAKDGWRVVVFYDVGDLDYICHFVTPTGEVIDFWEWDERNPDRRVLMTWRDPGDAKRLADFMVPPLHERVARQLCWLDGQDPDLGDRTWRDYTFPADAWLAEIEIARRAQA